MPEKLRICSFETRRAADMRSLIERHGGAATVVPSVREIPLEENPAVFDFAEQLLAGQIDLVIFMTGVGTRFLFEVVETRFPRERFLAALQRCQVVVRGPKPTTFLREWQVRIDHRAQEPNTWRELLEVVDSEAPVAGRTVAIQEYGEPNEEFYQELQRRGARILPVPVYRWALPEDSSPLRQALESTIAGEFDVLLFTSAIQFKNVLQVAGSANRGVEWIAAANRCVVASIGPTASETLNSAGLRVDIEASPPKMGQLVQAVFRDAPQILMTKI